MANDKKIGLALSGGGVRAAVFHLGVLRYLAEQKLLENVHFISTVSGGSLAIGLIYANHGNRWPTSSTFLEKRNVIKERICSSTVQRKFIFRSIFSRRFMFLGRAKFLAKYIENEWKIESFLNELPAHPRWIINATCYETGKNWIFSHKRMGDYKSGYVRDPSIKLSYCLAASAAVPGLIGPLNLKTDKNTWFNYDSQGDQNEIEILPKFKMLKLWDGGVYDNLGIEPLFKPDRGLRQGIDFLVVADASKIPKESNRIYSFLPPFFLAPLRLVDIATEQIRALRTRILMRFLREYPEKGVLFVMGYSSDSIAKHHNVSSPLREHLSEQDVQAVANFPTTLGPLSDEDYTRMERHGYEVAMSTMTCYQSKV